MEQLSRRIETSPRGALRFLISCWNRIVELSTFIATKLHLRCTAVEADLQSKSLAIESAMDGMAILDRDECYSYLNAAHARLYGYQSAEELLGKSWTVLYDEAELEWFKREVMPRLLQELSLIHI